MALKIALILKFCDFLRFFNINGTFKWP